MPEVDLSFAKIGKTKKDKSGSKEAWKNKRKRGTKRKRKERQEQKRQ